MNNQKLPVGKFPIYKRSYGEEQPYISIGPFKVRLPLIHYEWEWTECFAAMFLGVACLGSGVAVTMDVLGINSFEIALTFGVLNAICYALPAHLGDPVVPGWITPALPLTIGYLSKYAIGVERIEAMIALQILVALLFFLMGVTGIGKKLISLVPVSIRGGIILGAGLSAAINVMNTKLKLAPLTIILSTILAYFFLFSKNFERMASHNKWIRILRNQGIVPAQVFAIIVGPYILKELPKPEILWGFTPINFGVVFKNYTLFGLGFPELKLFLAAIPMAITAYIIAFGDFILAKEIVTDATATRDDEKVEFDASRSNLVSALRNMIMALFAPWVPMNGPLWASGLLTITERYKMGYKTLPSYWGGVGTFRAATVLAVMFMPLVTLIKPAFGIFFALTMVVQAFACGYIGMKMLEDNQQRGIAMVIACVLAVEGATYGLLTGVILFFLIEYKLSKQVSKHTN
ncbi:hypothetical protein [Inediibacterium massiliense]|uniref:hypothetical protein n=1 Tax=Inediibacterium massiliense TaxID=1658111 RepID=UPI0006B56C37|nr:hypothetical protein [Inediibacterium massiliense]